MIFADEPLKERSISFLKSFDRFAGVPALYTLAGLRSFLSLFLPPRKVRVRTIVMAKLWGVGNLVMIIPLIRAVRRRFPEGRLYFLTLERNAELLRDIPELDGILTLKTGRIATSISGAFLLPFRLRRLEPDLFLDFEQFLRLTPLVAVLSGATQRVGLKTPGQARAVLCNVKVPYRQDRHMALTFGDVVRCAGVDTSGLPALEVPRSPAAAARIDSLLESLFPESRKSLPPGVGTGASREDAPRPPLVLIHPGSGDNFPARRWPVENFASLAETVHRATGARVVLTGTAPEEPLAADFERICSVPSRSLVGRLGLAEFVELVARADLVVTNDTAPVHIASALKRPLIALYGPNSPDLYGPLNEESRSFYLRLPCSPCITNLNAKTSSCQVPSCILNIDPRQVAAAALGLLAGRKKTIEPRKAVKK